jgi:hypothetical protein
VLAFRNADKPSNIKSLDECKDLIKLIKPFQGRKDVKIPKAAKDMMNAFTVVDRDTKTFHGVGAVTDLDFMIPVKIGNEEQLLALRNHGMPYPPFCDTGIEHQARFLAARNVKNCHAKDALAYDYMRAEKFIKLHFKGNVTHLLADPRFEPLVKKWAEKFLRAKNNAMTDPDKVMYDDAVKALLAFDDSYKWKVLEQYLTTVDSEFKYKGCFASGQQNVNAIAVEKNSQTSDNELATKIVENIKQQNDIVKQQNDMMHLLLSKNNK